MDSKKRWIILLIIAFVSIAIPVTAYLFKNGYFDVRNRAANETNETIRSVTKYGDGSDGDCVVSSNMNINTDTCVRRTFADGVFYSVTSDVQSGSSVLTLSEVPEGLSVNDEVLLITLQGTAADFSGVGNYETAIVSAKSETTLTVATPLKNSYDGVNDKVIVQRVPNYKSVTINNGAALSSSPWNGTSGGVIAFKSSGKVTINGSVTADNLGYRGGAAYKGGEAFGGYNSGNSGSKVGNMGGGGGGNAPSTHASVAGGAGSKTGGAGGAGGNGSTGDRSENSLRGAGGGGAGYGTAGQGGSGNTNGGAGGENVSGKGGTSRQSSGRGTGGGGGGGGTYGYVDLSRLYFGSGGGGGGKGSGTPGAGGAGGGIIYISAKNIEVTGTLSSKGAVGKNGDNSSSQNGSGGGGGGAGGSIFLIADDLVLGENIVSALGGAGGSGRFKGGAGGKGRIRIEYYNTLTGTTDPVASAELMAGGGNYWCFDNTSESPVCTYDRNVNSSDARLNCYGTENECNEGIDFYKKCSYADLNGDGRVSMSDYSLFVEDYLDYRDNGNFNERSDFNDDGKVSMSDYSLFVSCYLEHN